MNRRVKCGRCLRVILVPIGVKVHFHRCEPERTRPAPHLETEEIGRRRFAEILNEARQVRENSASSAWGQTAATVHRLSDEGRTVTEIAAQLGVTTETVRGHLRKSR